MGRYSLGRIFTNVGGVTRNYIARLTNTDAALQDLKVSSDGSTVTWMRGQASPEVGEVAFEHSANGTTWTSLGNATRITCGRQLSGLSLPKNENHYVRARGYATAGYFNASSSPFESVRLFYLTPPTSVKNDFNYDGKRDILWRNTATGENAYWYMDGTNLIAGAVLPTVADLNWTIVGTGDFQLRRQDGYPLEEHGYRSERRLVYERHGNRRICSASYTS